MRPGASPISQRTVTRRRTTAFAPLPALIAAAVTVAALAGPVLAASAQTTSTTVTSPSATTASTPTTTSTTTTTTSTSPAGTGTGSTADHWIAVAILVLGALAVFLAYVFYDRWRQSYEKLAEDALRTTGHFPETEFDPVANAVFRTAEATPEAAQEQPVVKGPSTVVVGEPAVYKATVNGGPAAACKWAIQPPGGGATVDSATGAETTLTASAPGR